MTGAWFRRTLRSSSVLAALAAPVSAAYQAPAAGIGLPATPIAAAGPRVWAAGPRVWAAGSAGAIAAAAIKPAVSGPFANVAVAPVSRLRTPQDVTMMLADRAAGMRVRSSQLAGALWPAPAASELPDGPHPSLRGTSMAGGLGRAEAAGRGSFRVPLAGREAPVAAHAVARAELPYEMPVELNDRLSDLGWGAFFALLLLIATGHPSVLLLALIGGSVLSLLNEGD